jgi:NAD(P)-dependent dehydrogenase (short-subunit alcohol dehydrogenase family)
MELTGQVALITGGASGIGLGIARVLAERGVTLAVAYWDPEHREPAGALRIRADIRDRAAVDAMVRRVVDELGRIDLLVNSAAVTGRPAVAPFLDCSPGQLDAIVDTNLKGTFHVSQAVARHMVARGGGGSIIHITSVAAFAGQELASVYCATKAAVTSLTQTMALELAPLGIRVNAVAPGDILTPANAAIVSDLAAGGATGKFLRATPLGRRGTPEEIGRAVAFLASDDASFVTGATLLADGGFLAY